MSQGGARNRSGPPSDPNSARSDRRGVSLTALPSEGFKGIAPEFPLPVRVVVDVRWEDGSKVTEGDRDSTEALRDRELELWEWAWSTPQACAWAMPSEGWRIHSVAMWVRTAVICEGTDGTAADKNSLHRFADQIGLTPAGLKENGWSIKTDDLAQKASCKTNETKKAPPERRMRAVPGGGS